MGFIKAFIMDNNGAGWVGLDELTEEEKAQLEIAIAKQESGLACVICYLPILAGTGNTCEKHIGVIPNW
jgi:hypothetical protein